MPSKRTGLMPLKKKFTAVGGVGARPIALQNKISIQGPRVAGTVIAPAPAPAPAKVNNLFDIYSFGNIFSGDVIPGYPDKKLDPPHWFALIAAAVRWSNLLSFHPEGLDVIKRKYKKKFGKDWKGFELIAINYSEPNAIAGAKALRFSGTNIPYGFGLSINRNMLANGVTIGATHYTFSRENIEHVFAHELGHVLGLCNSITPEYTIRVAGDFNVQILNQPTHYKRLGGNLPNGFAFSAIHSEEFPKTYLENQKLIRSATRFIGTTHPYVLLSYDEKHWEEKTVSCEVHGWDPVNQQYRLFTTHQFHNFYNEIMTPGFHPTYDNEIGYLISTKTLQYLTELTLDGNFMFVEKTPGASEVSRVIKLGESPGLNHILKGKANFIIPASKGIAPVIAVERELSRNAYSIVYPDGGHCNDEEEIIQLARTHEQIVNDPAFFEFKCRH